MNRKVIWIVVALIALFVAAIVALVLSLAFLVFRIFDTTDAHICGLAAVRRSPLAARLVGTPIEQQGFTGGRSSTTNGELAERITFTVAGPLGQAFVVAEGFRSPIESRLRVRMGRAGQGETIYSGPFDCPELHRSEKK